MNEASYVIKKTEDDFVDKWSQTRYIAYAIIQSQSTKKLKPTDILEFPWEKKPSTTTMTTLSKEELVKHAQQMEKIINKKNGF